MCSRIEDVMSDAMRAALRKVLGPLRWNWPAHTGEVRPTDPVTIVRLSGSGQKEMTASRWGFVPSGMGPAELKKYALFNARIETLASSPVYSQAFQSQRCVIPLSAFYEWPVVEGKKQKAKMARPDGLPLLVAGLWNRCEGKEGSIESCTLVTRPPTPDLLRVHDRMPALLLSKDLDAWLHGTPEEAREALVSSWQPGIIHITINQRL